MRASHSSSLTHFSSASWTPKRRLLPDRARRRTLSTAPDQRWTMPSPAAAPPLVPAKGRSFLGAGLLDAERPRRRASHGTHGQAHATALDALAEYHAPSAHPGPEAAAWERDAGADRRRIYAITGGQPPAFLLASAGGNNRLGSADAGPVRYRSHRAPPRRRARRRDRTSCGPGARPGERREILHGYDHRTPRHRDKRPVAGPFRRS